MTTCPVCVLLLEYSGLMYMHCYNTDRTFKIFGAYRCVIFWQVVQLSLVLFSWTFLFLTVSSRTVYKEWTGASNKEQKEHFVSFLFGIFKKGDSSILLSYTVEAAFCVFLVLPVCLQRQIMPFLALYWDMLIFICCLFYGIYIVGLNYKTSTFHMLVLLRPSP